METDKNRSCEECQTPVDTLPTLVEFEGQEIFLFDPVVCKSCLLDLCKNHSAVCENCGGLIPPYTQVGVLKGDLGQKRYVHLNSTCSTVGSAFYGYLGKGKLHHFIEIEAC
ncbi:MAG: hypothetical protein NPINA01_26660 [Nitrospinaceae bacterium]|nr:MAG: hypothetical protein NPINA01_26660 [Nitrospinaceae bacterium]